MKQALEAMAYTIEMRLAVHHVTARVTGGIVEPRGICFLLDTQEEKWHLFCLRRDMALALGVRWNEVQAAEYPNGKLCYIVTNHLADPIDTMLAEAQRKVIDG